MFSCRLLDVLSGQFEKRGFLHGGFRFCGLTRVVFIELLNEVASAAIGNECVGELVISPSF